MADLIAKPEREIRIGPVKATIWAYPKTSADGKVFTSHRISLENLRREGQGSGKAADTLDVNDVPKAILALKKAYEYVVNPHRRQAGLTAPRTPHAPRRIP